MERNIRVFGKIVFILFCTFCFIWLIHKDQTFFQLKQPLGEGIRREDAMISIKVATEVLKDKNHPAEAEELQEWIVLMESEISGEMLTYEDYDTLLNLWRDKAGDWYEAYTYEKKYRSEFYLLKEDWYRCFDAFLDYYGLKDVIRKEKVNILTGRENLTGETIGESYLLTEKGEVVFYHSTEFETCYFSCVTAYVREKNKEEQKEVLTVVKKEKDSFTLKNVWVMEIGEEKLQFFSNGFEVMCPLGQKGDSDNLLREMVSDITFGEGKLTKIRQKTERVSGKLLRINDTELELEGSGIYKLMENVKVYQLYEELRECRPDDLRIGYDFADFVLEDGKICAALIIRKENMENIRVAIRNDGFASLYHENLTFQADCDMHMIYGSYDARKSLVIEAGKEIEIETGSEYLEGARVELIPDIGSGKIQISSLKRNQGVPAYRGKFEITETEEGLVLINEVLLEEYLYSVVPSEMPASYPHGALKAQSVCARTYAYRYLHAPGLAGLGAHVDDSVSYQVYNNIAENSNSTKAVKETMGELLFYEGDMVDTYYYSTSCGFGADAGVWQEENKETMPYLISRHITDEETGLTPENMMTEESMKEYLLTVNAKDYEAGEPWYRWEYEVSELDAEEMSQRLQERYQAAPDKILTQTEERYESILPEQFHEVYDMMVVKRRAGGIVDELLIDTDTGTYKIVSEYNIRYVLSAGGSVRRQDETEVACGQLLPSAYMTIDLNKTQDIVTGYQIIGGGYGHGVGMSQNGAKAMGSIGKTYEDILRFFYQNCEIKKMY